jgi:hypothetical protein
MVGKPDSLGFTGKPPPSTFNYRWDTACAIGEMHFLHPTHINQRVVNRSRDQLAI